MDETEELREIYRSDKDPLGISRDKTRVVTANDFIMSQGLDQLTLKARKLLYLAIGQCRKDDKEFYTYKITVKEFADIMKIDVDDVYKSAKKICGELMSSYITVERGVNRRGNEQFDMLSLFSRCQYRSGVLYFKLNPDMTDLLLDLQRNFTKPLLEDFMPMRSNYSIAIWHLMQMKMHSQFPGVRGKIDFDLSLNELRQVTGTQKKFKQIGQFREKVFDKAIREIEECAWVVVTYTDIKESRRVIGFRCQAVSTFHIDEKDIPREVREEAERKRREWDERKYFSEY